MISKINDWENIQAGDFEKLPLDAYVCKIKRAVVRSIGNGEALSVIFDISEGPFTGYFKKEFDGNSFENKKFKGVMNIFLPDGGEHDNAAKRRLKGFITAVCDSNPGFTWNWDENSLAGKTIGVIFRLEEWAYNGKTGWAVRPFRATAADNVRSGAYTIPDAKPLKNAVAPNAFADYAKSLENDDDCPF